MTTMDFAKSELNKYLLKMTGKAGNITLISDEDRDIFREVCKIEVNKGKGTISANCPRALLLGVYAFLRECGCRFLRPGEKGEYIPSLSVENINVSFVFEPWQRHRGITIEGAVSLENILELIDWAPKAGFNTYFTQFKTAFEFFDRWYSHKSNPFLKSEAISEEIAEKYVEKIVEEIKLRSMLYHAVGHGWTTGCLGLPCNGWSEYEQTLSEEKRALLAEINGKRDFFKGKPLNTHLCYSKTEARRLLAESVVEYAEAHPEIDVLHFWLADDFNNACECEECAKKRMSDWYVMILNDLDRMLTEKGLKVKIVFIVYLELYWPPLEEKIENPDRFIMMFAPIFRSYTEAYPTDSDRQSRPLMSYNKNQMEYSKNAEDYLAFLSAWKKVFKGESFDFDYHLMWDVHRDLGGERLAKVIYDDVHTLPKIGLNGFLSCQVQRAFYPNGLCFYILGRTLVDPTLSYEELCEEYYCAAFGKYADFARNYYTKIENMAGLRFIKGESNARNKREILMRVYKFLETTIDSFPIVEEDFPYSESMAILKFAAENALRLIRVLFLQASNASEKEILEADKERKDFFNQNELRFQPYADGFYVNLMTDELISAQKVGIFAE